MKKQTLTTELSDLAGKALGAFTMVAGAVSGASCDLYGNYLAGRNTARQVTGKLGRK